MTHVRIVLVHMVYHPSPIVHYEKMHTLSRYHLSILLYHTFIWLFPDSPMKGSSFELYGLWKPVVGPLLDDRRFNATHVAPTGVKVVYELGPRNLLRVRDACTPRRRL